MLGKANLKVDEIGGTPMTKKFRIIEELLRPFFKTLLSSQFIIKASKK